MHGLSVARHQGRPADVAFWIGVGECVAHRVPRLPKRLDHGLGPIALRETVILEESDDGASRQPDAFGASLTPPADLRSSGVDLSQR